MQFETVHARKSVRRARSAQALRFPAALAACREGIPAAAPLELSRNR